MTDEERRQQGREEAERLKRIWGDAPKPVAPETALTPAEKLRRAIDVTKSRG